MRYETVMDLHTHTIASGHAYNTLREMAKAAAERIISRVKGLDKGPGRLSIISGNLIDGESVRALI